MLNPKMIGDKIAEARKKINISQAQLARQLFISSQAVGKWERGESMPDIITLNRLAEIMAVDLNYFSEGIKPMSIEIMPSGNLEHKPDELPFSNARQLPVEKKGKKPGWDMSRGNWVDADFSGLKNLHEKFGSSNMQRCKFIGSELTGLLLKGNNVESCDFSGSDFSRSHIQGSNLSNNVFKDCALTETKFSESNVYNCDFTGTDFSVVEFKSGGFSGVKVKAGGEEKNTISNAVWNRTIFNGMHIVDVVFGGLVEDCSFENCAFTRVTFRNARLINTFFKNKTLKKISFIDCLADRMTYEFLKNGKADLTGIRLIS